MHMGVYFPYPASSWPAILKKDLGQNFRLTLIDLCLTQLKDKKEGTFDLA